MEKFFAVLILIVGIWNIVHPRSAWFLSEGWKYKDLEPSEEGLVASQFGGVVAVIIALAILF